MSDVFSYSKNGVHKFENFKNHLRRDDFEPVSLGFLGGCHWSLEIQRSKDRRHVFSCFFGQNDNSVVEYRICGYMNIWNKDPSRDDGEVEGITTLPYDEVCTGPYMPIREILNMENGWLQKDGSLIVEYGIQVEAILEGKIWKFNFHDRIFDCRQKGNMISFDSSTRTFHCHKQLVTLHSSRFTEEGNQKTSIPNHLKLWAFKEFLQVAHGVRMEIHSIILRPVIKIAHHYNMWNVARLCEYHLIRNETYFVDYYLSFKFTMKQARFAIKNNLRHYLARLLKTKHCSNRVKFLKWILKNLDLEKIKGGPMKMLVKKILYDI